MNDVSVISFSTSSPSFGRVSSSACVFVAREAPRYHHTSELQSSLIFFVGEDQSADEHLCIKTSRVVCEASPKTSATRRHRMRHGRYLSRSQPLLSSSSQVVPLAIPVRIQATIRTDSPVCYRLRSSLVPHRRPCLALETTTVAALVIRPTRFY